MVGSGSAAILINDICGQGLMFRADGFHMLFACLATYMWIMTLLFSREYMSGQGKKGRYYIFIILTYLATVGVFLSDDLFTAFIFFEMMSFFSYVCVIHDEKGETVRAGNVYLAVAIIGGLVSLMGMYMLYDLTGTLSVSELRGICASILVAGGPDVVRLNVIGGCILFGYGAKAGMFPVHVWLPLAHPVAPAPASALLSGIITKSGIFGLIILTAYLFPDYHGYGGVLCVLGVVTMVHGGVIALFSTNIKRTLACSSISQLGMIIFAIGMQELLGAESALASRGALMHMINHANFKLVLFMAAGVIAMDIHKLELNDIRGYGRNKPMLRFVFLMGALGIAGIPMFSGYISKTVIHESLVEYIDGLRAGHMTAIWGISESGVAALFSIFEVLFMITGGLTVAYMTKLFVCVFVEKNNDQKVQKKYDKKGKAYCSKLSAAVLIISSLVFPVMGMIPHATIEKLAGIGAGFMQGAEATGASHVIPAAEIEYFSASSISGALISIAIGAVIYILSRMFLMEHGNVPGRPAGSAVDRYADRWPAKFDLLKSVYEPLILVIFPDILGTAGKVLDGLTDGVIALLKRTIFSTLPDERPPGKEPSAALRRLSRNQRIIAATAAYSFALLGIGLIFIVIYVLM